MPSTPVARILIVDDEAANMRALCDTLRDHNFDTEGFTSGERALDALRETQFDVLLTDLMMPGMDGVALLSEALKIDPQLVGVLMTGKGTVETAVAAMKAGALDYVLKPVRLNNILPVLSRAIDVRRLRLEVFELRNTVAIHELNQAMAHTLDPNVLLDKIADAIMAQFGADEASVMLLSDDGTFLYVAAVRGADRGALLGSRLPLGEGIAGKAAARQEPIVLQGEAKGPDPVSFRPRPDLCSALSMPMSTRGKLIGVLNVSFTRRPASFSLGQVRLLNIFTNAAAAGIEAAKLYESQRKADARFRQVLDMAADAIVSLDDALRITVFNSAAERIFGWPAKEAVGKNLDLLIPERLLGTHRQHIELFDTAPETAIPMQGRGPFPARRKDGSEFPAEISISRNFEGGRKTYTAVLRDVTLRVQQERRITRLTRIHRVLSGINSAIVRIRNREEMLNEACRIAIEEGEFGVAWIGMLELETQDIVPVASAGIEADLLVGIVRNSARADLPQGQGIVGRAIRAKRVFYSNDLATETGPGGARRKEALRRGYRSVIVLPLIVEHNAVGVISLFAREPGFFDDEEIKLLTELAEDISFSLDHIAKSEKLDYLAFYDALTGLPNPTLFNDRIDRIILSGGANRSGPAVAVLGVERMRNINESLGLAAGDELLRQVGMRLKSHVGETGTVARLGGDLFGIEIHHQDDPEHNARAAERCVVEGLRAPIRVGQEDIHVTMRMGIATYPDDGADAASLRANADAAQIRAKERGERLLFYSRDMNARVLGLLKLENELRNAISREQFVLYYQPKFDLASRTITGAEALLRWKHPDRGMVSPGEFIPLLEETGMIIEVGRWALHRAASDQIGWVAAGVKAPRVAVNVSLVQLRRSDFVDYVKGALSGVGRANQSIDLEITESMLMEKIDENIEKLDALQSIGINIALDDFGTGYSSLSYLTRLPINSLKIDRSFVIRMARSPEQLAIVSTVISLARTLNLKVVAEGVETEEQANLLRLLRCDEVQGYLFGKPVPADEFEALLTRPKTGSNPDQ